MNLLVSTPLSAPPPRSPALGIGCDFSPSLTNVRATCSLQDLRAQGQDGLLTLIHGHCRPPWYHFQGLQPEAFPAKEKAEFISLVEPGDEDVYHVSGGDSNPLFYPSGQAPGGASVLTLGISAVLLRSGNHSFGD